MNVYDFDGTIYQGDSSLDFYFYALRHNPWIVRYALKQAWAVAKKTLGMIGTTQMKAEFFSFLAALEDTEETVDMFWDANLKKISKWYADQKNTDDLVISASPDFLVRPACCRLGIQPPIATVMDARSGRIQGKNCRGEEKVRRFYELFPRERIRQFYSDSMADTPMANIADEAFLVKGNRLFTWENIHRRK